MKHSTTAAAACWLAAALGGCSAPTGRRPAPVYSLVYETRVDPTDTTTRRLMARFITETVRANAAHLTGGDIEDPEDILRVAQGVAEDLFAQPVALLRIGYPDREYDETKARWELNPAERAVYQRLLGPGGTR
jgi:hypothetical protein